MPISTASTTSFQVLDTCIGVYYDSLCQNLVLLRKNYFREYEINNDIFAREATYYDSKFSGTARRITGE
jgi:hypothetical protein